MSDGEGTDERPSVGIVVLTWENYDEASDCLDSLQSITYPDASHRVIVVDNGSEDGSVERLEDEYGWCEFVRNDENLGFARGNNAGIRRALDAGVDYVLLLNDDTVVTEDFLEPLVRTAEERRRVAAVGGVIYRAETEEIHNAGYRFYPAAGGKAGLIREPKDEPYPVDYVQSCLVLLDAEFLAEVGLLNESYFIGMEDVDLAWKARERGWQVLTTPESRIYHRIGVTSDVSPFMSYHRTRNKLRFAAENFDLVDSAAFYLSYAVTLVLAYAKWLTTGHADAVRASLLGARDYFADEPFRPYDDIVG